MSEKKIIAANNVKKGSYILIDGGPCIVRSEPQISRPGKHGHAKIRIKATNIITNSTKEIVKPGHDHIEVPIILKKKGQVLSKTDADVELMDLETFETHTVPMSNCDDEVVSSLESGQEVSFWEVMGQIMIKKIN